VTSAPSVSVIIPTYNYARFLRTAIDSALAQTLPAKEVIVVDDGSTDETPDVLAAYGDRITVLHRQRGGVGAARNAAMAAATGDYFGFLDADDAWDPRKLEVQIALAQRQPATALIGCGYRTVDETGTQLAEHAVKGKLTLSPKDAVAALLLFETHVGGTSGVLVRADIARLEGGFHEQLVYAEDWDLWMRIASHTGLLISDETLVSIRQHQGGTFRNAERLATGMLSACERAVARHSFTLPQRCHARANVWQHIGFEFEIARDAVKARDAYRKAALLWPLNWKLVYKALRPLPVLDERIYGGGHS
jgi:glycosyltransferase involved in cell wall biosynthesis